MAAADLGSQRGLSQVRPRDGAGAQWGMAQSREPGLQQHGAPGRNRAACGQSHRRADDVRGHLSVKPTEQNKQRKQSHRCRQHVDGSLGGGASGCPWKPVSGKGLSLPEASRQHLVKSQRKPGDAPRDPASGSVLSPVGSPAGPPKRPEPPGTCPSPTDVVSQVGPSQPRTVTRRGRESQGRKRVARPRGNKGHALAGTER